ncbi:MAG: HAD family hydrolase [Candidatus Aenigmarchaeota archaeon]
MRIDGIGFDYGNTLVSDPFGKVMDLKALEFLKVMEKNGYGIPKERLVKAWSDVNIKMNYPHCSHFAQGLPLVRTTLEKLGVEKSDRSKIAQQLLVVYRGGLKHILRNDYRIEETKRVLGDLRGRGKRLFVVSNESVDTLNMQLSWTGFRKFFEKVIVSGRLGIEKPDIRVFRHMVNMFGLPEERILYVGDDPERDIKPSKEIGIKAVIMEHPKEMAAKSWRDYNYELKGKEKPDFVIKDLSELLQIVE